MNVEEAGKLVEKRYGKNWWNCLDAFLTFLLVLDESERKRFLKTMEMVGK